MTACIYDDKDSNNKLLHRVLFYKDNKESNISISTIYFKNSRVFDKKIFFAIDNRNINAWSLLSQLKISTQHSFTTNYMRMLRIYTQT